MTEPHASKKKDVTFATIDGTLMGMVGSLALLGFGDAAGNLIGRTFNIQKMIRDDNFVYNTRGNQVATIGLIAGLSVIGGYIGNQRAKANNMMADHLEAAQNWSTRVSEGDLARPEAGERGV